MGCLGCREFGCSRRGSAGTFILPTTTNPPQPHFFFCPLKLFWASDCVPTTKKKQLLAAADADEFHGVLPGLVQSN